MRGFPSALAGVRRTMHTLQQLRSGELTGATRLDLSCGLREFPGKSSNWPTPGGAQPQRQRPGQPAGRPRPAASSQGAVLFRQRLRRIAGGGGRLSGAEHGRLQVQPHRAGAGRGPAAGVALADPHRQPDCHAARGTGPPAVAEADVGRQPPGGLAREHGRLRTWNCCGSPPTVSSACRPGWRRCRAWPGWPTPATRCAACRRWPTAASPRWTGAS